MSRPVIAVYPKAQLEKVIRELAAEDGRSASNLIVEWCKQRPEVQERLNGRTEK